MSKLYGFALVALMGIGSVFAVRSAAAGPYPAPTIVKKGFKVELIYTVPKKQQGSWVSMTVDDKGRLIACDQGKAGVWRLTPPPLGKSEPVKVEKLNIPVTGSMGMLWAFDSLFFTRGGLHRAVDSNNDGEVDTVKTLRKFSGGGEHGPHAIVPSPDGKSIYFIAGNSTKMTPHESSLAPKVWKEDQLLPRQWDARGHARGRLAPGGWIARIDPEGKHCQIVAMGFRNPYDMDFNHDGELFAYDADMEWDSGSPWYRPTRLSHVASGSESGWRSGTGKFPAYYPDTLPATIDIGPGSPTGVVSGRGAKFPAKYQKALFLNDWTFGTIHAVHLTPSGSTYTATKEEFIAGKPLPLTDIVINPKDGAMYFAVGGRGGQSAVYRVTYTGSESTAPVTTGDKTMADARALRHKLESFHGKKDPKAVATAWPHLNHEDRFIRFAARVAIEHQPVASWRAKALAEKDPMASIQACIALARHGDKSDGPKITAALNRIDFGSLGEYAQLALLRAHGINFARHGGPDKITGSAMALKFDAYFPAASDPLNRELVTMLAFLQSPTVAAKTVPLMAQSTDKQLVVNPKYIARNDRYGRAFKGQNAANPQRQQIWYAYALRTVKTGWTEKLRTQYFQWFNNASKFKGGNSFGGFIKNIKKEALKSIDDKDLAKKMEKVSGELESKVAKVLPRPEGPGRNWTYEQLIALEPKTKKGRDFKNGKKMYAAAMCAQCHVLAGEGGLGGPDLTQLAGRYAFKDMIDNIIHPSKVISDQYQNIEITKKDGTKLVGRVVGEENGSLKVMPTPLNPDFTLSVPKDQVAGKKPSKISSMMPGLLNALNEEEVLNLLAYIRSAGKASDPAFK